MINLRFSLFLVFFAGLILAGCNDDDDNGRDPLNVPDAYDGSNFEANTITDDAARSQLSTFVNKAKEGRTPGVQVSASELDQLFAAGSPSLQDVTTSYYAGRVSGWIDELASASGNSYTPGQPNGNGGTLGGYLFDENGLELEQLLDKGLYGAAMYNHAISLIDAGNLTPATVDRLVSIFGAHPDFPNTNNSATADNPDQFLANYTARRDKNDGEGLYSQMKAHFITLQAALQAGDLYNAERDQALADLLLTWEQCNAATAINYCHQTLDKLSETNLTDDQIGSGLHSYAEAVGFLHGWRTIPAEYKLITDAEIDQLLALLNAPYGGTPTSYTFVTDPANELPKVQQVIDELQGLYGFTDQEIEDFKENWVNVQGR